MQAKLRKLKDIKEKHQLKNQQNMTKIEFMNNIKQRNLNAFQYKQKVDNCLFSSKEKVKSLYNY